MEIPNSIGIYPYIPFKHGYLFHKRLQKGVQSLKGESGIVVRSEVSETLLSLSDDSSPDFNYKLRAELCRSTLYTSFATRFKGQPHPDFYAGDFVKYSLFFFEANGARVRNYMARLFTGSTVLQEFINARQFLPDLEAAHQTWAAKIFIPLGFEIERVTFQQIKRPGSEEFVNRFALLHFTRS